MRLGRKKATQRLNECCAFEVEGSAALDAVLLSWKASVAENQGREGQGGTAARFWDLEGEK